MSEPTTAELVERVLAGAHFYMAHRMTEYPHPSAPEITMAKHDPDDEGCPGCLAIHALDALAAHIEEQAKRIEELEGECDYFRSRLTDFSAVSQADFARAEAAEARVRELKEALDVAHARGYRDGVREEKSRALQAAADPSGEDEEGAA